LRQPNLRAHHAIEKDALHFINARYKRGLTINTVATVISARTYTQYPRGSNLLGFVPQPHLRWSAIALQLLNN